MEERIFKAYDIRGIYGKEFNKEDVKKIAQAYLYTISQKLNKPIKELHLAVGRDIRASSEELLDTAIEVFLSYGVTVDTFGLFSINDFYFSIGYYKYDAGFMATASHNPPEYGGVKMAFLSLEQDDVLNFVSGKELYQELIQMEFPLSAEQLPGQLNEKEAFVDHLEHVLSFVDISKIRPLKVVVDTGNGMNGLMIPKIFDKIPCELIHLFPDLNSDFSNRPPNPLAEGAADQLAARVQAENADLGVIYDVDGDRMFLVDEKGGFVRGDMVLLLLAQTMLKKYPQGGIVYNLICSHAVPDLVTKWGGRPIRSEVGYVNLSRHMNQEDGIMSGELSAHFAFRDNFYADNGFIALLLVLQTISEGDRKLSEIIKEFQLYAKGDEINLPVEDIPAALDKIRNMFQDNIKDEIDGITAEFEDWWFNVRPSNTEPLLRVTVEAANQPMLQEKTKEIIDLINN
ncbi:phosphomannomutase/phosphoglucomutase [bacterium]|jgi:phosphomannomutase|nr:phosphomannomutase/phosphoglucomutase [bacterium]MBT4649166.1 phosphomannomutase/phosphoglucomutase [bacterium]